MARQVEATYAWLENVTYQYKTMSHDEAERVGRCASLSLLQTFA
jgi:hypothetical protein